jgi:hypothetical protein
MVASASAVTVMLATAAQAGAAITLGQTGPPAAGGCLANFDRVQPPVTSGNTYVVPGTGTITSWSNNTGAGAGQIMRLKIFRQGAGSSWTAGAADVPRTLVPNTVNTFTGLSLPVKPGDSLGLHTGTGTPTCDFAVTGETYFRRAGDLANGQSGDFTMPINGFRLNVSAVFVPTNTFSLGAAVRNKKKGTATITATVPNSGELTVSGNGVKTAGARTSVAVSAGTARLTIRATGKKKKKLKTKGKAKLAPTITYTPTGGDPRTQSTLVRLKKKLKRK